LIEFRIEVTKEIQNVRTEVQKVRIDMGSIVEATLRARVQQSKGHDYGKSISLRSLWDIAGYFSKDQETISKYRQNLSAGLLKIQPDFIKWVQTSKAKTKIKKGEFSSCLGSGLQVLSWCASKRKTSLSDFELDCGGIFETYKNTAIIDISEIKSSNSQVKQAVIQLERNLIILCEALKHILPNVTQVIMIGRVFYSFGIKCDTETHKNVGPDTLSIRVVKM